MPPKLCQQCEKDRAVILRPKDQSRLCKGCFLDVFEREIHHTITTHKLFSRGERVAVGASGGKDSTVLASVLKTLNERHDYGLDLILLSIDEGITGYRDDSLETVKRNSEQYGMQLCILGYKELYGWTMDEVVNQIGKKGNCTYCGVFRRQALDRGAGRLGVKHVVTGHNADDIAETVLMNLLRGDLPRLSRATSIIIESASSQIKRSKPLKYAYEKEIVLYAHHKKLEYFSTECIYSPEAFRGSARALVKNLEKIRPSAILDLVRSGEDMAKLVPESVSGTGRDSKRSAGSDAVIDDEEGIGGCGSAHGRSSGGEMAAAEKKLQENDEADERETDMTSSVPAGQWHDRHTRTSDDAADTNTKAKHLSQSRNTRPEASRKLPKQQIGQCERCGYMSSQKFCKACMLLEGLNKSRPSRSIGADASSNGGDAIDDRISQIAISSENG